MTCLNRNREIENQSFNKVWCLSVETYNLTSRVTNMYITQNRKRPRDVIIKMFDFPILLISRSWVNDELEHKQKTHYKSQNLLHRNNWRLSLFSWMIMWDTVVGNFGRGGKVDESSSQQSQQSSLCFFYKRKPWTKRICLFRAIIYSSHFE